MAREDTAQDAVEVTWPQVHAFRVARHHLDRPVRRARLTEALADAGGVQAQVMAAARLALRVRVRGLTVEDIERALWHDRSLARVWCLRGTVHLVPAEELEVYVRGCSSRQEGRLSAWMDRRGVSRASLDRLIDAASAAMDRPRTREELAARIHDSLGWPVERAGWRGWGGPANATGFRLGRSVVTIPDIAFTASYRGLACFGPDERGGTTFVRPDAWLRGWREMSVEDAEAALLRRHLRSFGPATVSDFAMWTILTMTRARQAWTRLEDDLQAVTVEGRPGWVLRRDLPSLEHAKLPKRTVRLLPYFDSFLLGHKERGHLVDAAHYKRIYRSAGWVYPAVLVDGRIAGHWSYERRGKRLQVDVQPYAPLDGETKDLVRSEADDVARFLGVSEAHASFARAR